MTSLVFDNDDLRKMIFEFVPLPIYTKKTIDKKNEKKINYFNSFENDPRRNEIKFYQSKFYYKYIFLNSFKDLVKKFTQTEKWKRRGNVLRKKGWSIDEARDKAQREWEETKGIFKYEYDSNEDYIW